MGYRKQNPLSVNGVLIADANKVTSSTSAVNKAVLTTDAIGLPALTALAADGQLIIGSTAGAPAAASLTAGTGITITPGSNAITIAVSGSVVGQTITGDSGGALSPTAGNWNFDANPSAGASVSFSGSGSTLTLNVSDLNNNTFVGVSCGNLTLTSILTTGFGSNTLKALTSGNNNSSFGFSSLASLTSGSNNYTYGNSTGSLLVTGSHNLIMGGTGALGSGTQYTTSESSNIIFNNVGTILDNNTTRIGTQGSGNGQQNKCFIAGITGVSVSNLNLVTINTATGQLGSAASTTIVPTGATGTVLQGAGAGVLPVYSTATYPATATGTGTLLRADGTNWVATTSTYPNTNAVSTLLYASSANVMAALATANSGVLTTSSSGVPSIDTTNFAVLSTGVQMKGNNTNTAPPAGFIGEVMTGTASSVATTSGAAKTITSVTLTAGVWNISGMASSVATGGAGLMAAQLTGISTTDNTITGTLGQDYFQTNVTAAVLSGCVAPLRVLLSGSTTYYLVVNNTYSSTTCPTNARITAVRAG